MDGTFNHIDAQTARQKLVEGNKKYITTINSIGDISKTKRDKTLLVGQHPYAVVITCSDSRVIPEAIFSAGIGDLFVIRVAGNVIDRHQLGSIEYAIDHLGCKLVLVLGHTDCGAVGAALKGSAHGFVRFITDEIRKAIGTETDAYTACRLNVIHSVNAINSALDLTDDNSINNADKNKISVIGGIYNLETGIVEFI